MKVDRCVCVPITFERLKALADLYALDFEGLKARTNCSRACGLCEPYVRRMLETGQTVFHEALPPVDRASGPDEGRM